MLPLKGLVLPVQVPHMRGQEDYVNGAQDKVVVSADKEESAEKVD